MTQIAPASAPPASKKGKHACPMLAECILTTYLTTAPFLSYPHSQLNTATDKKYSRLLSLTMKLLSKFVVHVDTNPKSERIAVLKDKNTLDQLHDDDTNAFQKNLIDRYQHIDQGSFSPCT